MTMTKIPEFLSKCRRPQQKLIHFINETKATTTTWWQWRWHELNTWRFDIPKITENINWHFTLHYSLCHCMITMYAYSIIISHLLLYSRFFTFFLCVSIPLCTQLPVWVQQPPLFAKSCSKWRWLFAELLKLRTWNMHQLVTHAYSMYVIFKPIYDSQRLWLTA